MKAGVRRDLVDGRMNHRCDRRTPSTSPLERGPAFASDRAGSPSPSSGASAAGVGGAITSNAAMVHPRPTTRARPGRRSGSGPLPRPTISASTGASDSEIPSMAFSRDANVAVRCAPAERRFGPAPEAAVAGTYTRGPAPAARGPQGSLLGPVGGDRRYWRNYPAYRGWLRAHGDRTPTPIPENARQVPLAQALSLPEPALRVSLSPPRCGSSLSARRRGDRLHRLCPGNRRRCRPRLVGTACAAEQSRRGSLESGRAASGPPPIEDPPCTAEPNRMRSILLRAGTRPVLTTTVPATATS